jgi:hypothetical protein
MLTAAHFMCHAIDMRWRSSSPLGSLQLGWTNSCANVHFFSSLSMGHALSDIRVSRLAVGPRLSCVPERVKYS